MSRFRPVLLLGVILGSGCWQSPGENRLEVTYIANEGFMVSLGDTKVLVDALPRSAYYANPSDTLARKIMSGESPFNRVAYFLVTHDHPDHFNAYMASRFLREQRDAHFIADSLTCERLTRDSISEGRRSGIDLTMGEARTVRGEIAEIVVLRLQHVGGNEISNLAYCVRSHGLAFLHVGDARLEYNEETLRKVDWSSFPVDLLFIQYFDNSSATWDFIEKTIKPKHVVLMHIPPGEEDSVRTVNAAIHPQAIVFDKEGETRSFDPL